MFDISKAAVLKTLYMSRFELRIADIFCEEIFERSGIELRNNPVTSPVTIEFYNEENMHYYEEDILQLFGQVPAAGKEGFRIRIIETPDNARVIILGKDERGEFYGMARLLRKICYRNHCIMCHRKLDGLSVTPEYSLRGHQLGYRDKNNTYSAWKLADFDRYIRDMALFGANAIELLPPKTDDKLFSATFAEDPLEILVGVSKIIHSYHMDVWLWYPNVGRDYDDFDCISRELEEREKIFSAIPYLNAILVPLGDPGSLWPAKAMKVTEQFVKIMKKYHPDAEVWVAPQHFQPEPGWYDDFYKAVAEEPEWITGICFAPWEQHSIAELRDKLPARYKYNIRNYPDISHNSNCQFPVPMWDNAFALTIGREGYNARPKAMKYIHNLMEPYTCGSITYSEGIHDDINKIIWCDQDFDSTTDIRTTLQDYVRFFIDSDMADELTELILLLEENWTGAIAENKGIDRTYEELRRIDKKTDDKTRENYRYLMIKLRVLTDYWTKYKYIADQKNEKEARLFMARAKETGSEIAIKEARSVLNRSKDIPEKEDILFEMQKIADSLYQKCHIQLTVGRHGGQSWIRGAYMEALDMPLNEYQFLMQSFKKIEKNENEDQRTRMLINLSARECPGEGNIYCNLGTYEGFKHVTQLKTWEEDPGYLKTPLKDHSIYSMLDLLHSMKGWYSEFPMPLKWAWNATALYGTPLEVVFEGLDPQKEYMLKVFYPNIFLDAIRHMKKNTECYFWAGDVLVEDSIPVKEATCDVIWTYELPKESYKTGVLSLKWQVYGILKALAVSEIWIIQK